MWVPDEGEDLYRRYVKKADENRKTAEDAIAGVGGMWRLGVIHVILLVGAVALSFAAPELGTSISFAWPFTSAALAFVSVFSLSMIRALSDTEREYEQAAFEYSLKLTETVNSQILSENYKRTMRIRIDNMFERMDNASRLVIINKVWAKLFTQVSFLDLGFALVFVFLAHIAMGQLQAGLFWLSLFLTLQGLLLTTVFTASATFQYY